MRSESRNRAQRVGMARDRWAAATGYTDKTNVQFKFAEFTGDPHHQGRNQIVNIENPEVMRLVDLINGPNGHAIIKIMMVKGDVSNE